MIYVFRNIDEVTGVVSYGFIPEDKISDVAKELAFKILDELPVAGDELNGKEYALDYNEAEDKFFWFPIRDLPVTEE